MFDSELSPRTQMHTGGSVSPSATVEGTESHGMECMRRRLRRTVLHKEGAGAHCAGALARGARIVWRLNRCCCTGNWAPSGLGVEHAGWSAFRHSPPLRSLGGPRRGPHSVLSVSLETICLSSKPLLYLDFGGVGPKHFRLRQDCTGASCVIAAALGRSSACGHLVNDGLPGELAPDAHFPCAVGECPHRFRDMGHLMFTLSPPACGADCCVAYPSASGWDSVCLSLALQRRPYL